LHDATNIPRGLLCAFLGSVAVYATVFAVGMFLYDQPLAGVLLSAAAVAAAVAMFAVWRSLAADGTPA
jgi:hypothetical protein